MKHQLEIEDRCWNESLPLLSLPRFKCPCCHTGHFVVNGDSLRSEQTSQSIKEQYIISDIDCIRSRFIAMATCDNPDCKEPLAMAGWSKLHAVPMEYFEIPVGHPGHYLNYVPDYTITYLSAPVALIRILSGIDDKLQELLDSAFLSFWTDSHTCANKLRHVLEYLLSEKLKVSKVGSLVLKCGSHTCPRESRKRDLTLDEQITEFLQEEGKSSLSKHFKALRVIGNSGSHITDDKIERPELMKAFKVLESLLSEIYKDTKQIDVLSDEIIHRRKSK